MTAAAKAKIKFDAAAKAGRLGNMKRAVGTSTKPVVKRGVAKGKPIKPLIKKLKSK